MPHEASGRTFKRKLKKKKTGLDCVVFRKLRESNELGRVKICRTFDASGPI